MLVVLFFFVKPHMLRDKKLVLCFAWWSTLWLESLATVFSVKVCLASKPHPKASSCWFSHSLLGPQASKRNSVTCCNSWPTELTGSACMEPFFSKKLVTTHGPQISHRMWLKPNSYNILKLFIKVQVIYPLHTTLPLLASVYYFALQVSMR